MLKNHPRGIYVAFAANAGERFAFYIMLAVLSLFLQFRHGLSVAEAGDYYSWFYFGIYAAAMLGGAAADWLKRYKWVIRLGQVLMIAGYAMLACPGLSFGGSMVALAVIALGNGLFRGNWLVVVGHLYDDERYAKLRESAFLFFYMGINIGAFAAPFVASGIRDLWLERHGFGYDSTLPALCRQLLEGMPTDTERLSALAQRVNLHQASGMDLHRFAAEYLDVFARGYHGAFALAALSMLFSLLVTFVFNRSLPTREVKPTTRQFIEHFRVRKPIKQRKVTVVIALLIALSATAFLFVPAATGMVGKITLSLAVGLFIAFVVFIYLMADEEERPRVVPLIFLLVITVFFWTAFNQNGLVLTQFAYEYTAKSVDRFTALFFNFGSMMCLVLFIVGLAVVFHARSTLRYRTLGGGLAVVSVCLCAYFYRTQEERSLISPEVFQSFNPIFVLLLMPVVIWFFGFLRSKGENPSTPKQIGIGLFIAGAAFLPLLIGSLQVVSPVHLQGSLPAEEGRVSPFWLMSTYFMLTIAELFLSPMGASFISRVAPKRFQGLMHAGWLFTAALGGKFLFFGSYLWNKVELYVLWGIFALICILSGTVIFIIIKRLEKSS